MMSLQAEESVLDIEIHSDPAKNQENVFQRSDSVEKLGDLDRLFSIVIHQIRNHCMSVKGYASMLKYDEGISGNGRKWLSKITRGINGLESFLNEFEAYRLSKRPKNKSLNVELLVREAWNSLTEMAGRNVEIDIEIEHGLTIMGDENDFSKMLYHLLRNALEAVDDNGVIHIEIKKTPKASDAGCEWRLTVRDNGKGMTEEELMRAGEILFTTKQGHIGCGFCLVTAVATRLHADVELSSRTGAGSTIRIGRRMTA